MKKNIELNSYAKINLFLDVTGKRADGYHNIKSVMQSISLHDKVKINEIKSGIRIECNNRDIPLNKKNTCYKAAALIKEKFNINQGINISIDKTIPIQAGLAGGSTNAAAVIRGLNELWNLGMTTDEMKKLGVEIGADVVFCITGGTCLCEGIGDKITEIKSFKWDNIIVVKPDFSIPTPVVYKNITCEEYNCYKDNKILNCIENEDYSGTCMSVANTLEIAAVKLYPQIPHIKEDLTINGAISSIMTGSGSSVYGFYKDNASMLLAYENLSKKYSKIFMTKTILNQI